MRVLGVALVSEYPDKENMKKTFMRSEIIKVLNKAMGYSESPTLPVKLWDVEGVVKFITDELDIEWDSENEMRIK